MWAIINKKNNLNLPHIHPNCYLSAAYYVKTHDGCGKIKFTNPNLVSRQRSPLIENKTDFNQNGIEVDPKEGDLLFFPAYLTHEVLRNNSDNERIVISFNIKNIHPHDLAQFLNEYNIAVRVGHHCAQPLLSKLNETFFKTLIFFWLISSITAGGGTDNFPCSV